jgi:hypothetical protein
VAYSSIGCFSHTERADTLAGLQKIRIEAIDRFPVRNAKRGLARSPLIERNRGGDAEQIG